jgi:pimeloyl-ACP methyl ester carboxylesterase
MDELEEVPVPPEGDATGAVFLADGRTVAFFDGGDPDGFPVIGLHGTPGCRLNRLIDDSVYAQAGVRYVTTDRAGYGLSTRHWGRSVADEASDVLAVADALGFERFSVVGGSGGGPHALACAALMDGRVVRVACQSSLAPLGTRALPRDEWLTDMDPEIAAELAWAETGEEVLTREMERAQELMASRLAEDPGMIMGSEASPGDVEFLLRPEVIAAFDRIVPEQARHGVGGSVDDTLAFAKHWGFDLSAITVPVLLTYGAEDSSCPVAHGRFLARSIPTAITIEVAGEGHFAADPRNEVLATHRWLRLGGVPAYPSS